MRNFKGFFEAIDEKMANQIEGIQYDGDEDAISIDLDVSIYEDDYYNCCEVHYIDGLLSRIDKICLAPKTGGNAEQEMSQELYTEINKLSQEVFKWWNT